MIGIAAVIPTYNRGRMIGRAIESVLNQTVKPNQIIVVDDGSIDNTAAICAEYSQQHVEYVRQANAGVSQARNHGIRLARHDWIAFLDSDDFWTPTHLERITSAIEDTSGKASFYFSDIRTFFGPNESTLWSKIGFKFDSPFLLTQNGTSWMLSSRQPSSIQCSVFKSTTLKASGGFDRRFQVMEDTELFCRLGIGGSICAVNNVGCVITAEDDRNNRLTALVHCYTESYWNHACMLWDGLLSRFPDLVPPFRRAIRYNLAAGYWRLSRFYWRARRFRRGFVMLIKSAMVAPAFIFWLLRYRSSTGWEEYVLPTCRPVSCQRGLNATQMP